MLLAQIQQRLPARRRSAGSARKARSPGRWSCTACASATRWPTRKGNALRCARQRRPAHPRIHRATRAARSRDPPAARSAAAPGCAAGRGRHAGSAGKRRTVRTAALARIAARDRSAAGAAGRRRAHRRPARAPSDARAADRHPHGARRPRCARRARCTSKRWTPTATAAASPLHGDYVPRDDYRIDLVATAVLPARGRTHAAAAGPGRARRPVAHGRRPRRPRARAGARDAHPARQGTAALERCARTPTRWTWRC